MVDPSLDIDLEILPPGEKGETLQMATEEEIAKRSQKKSVTRDSKMDEEEDYQEEEEEEEQIETKKKERVKEDYGEISMKKEKVKRARKEILDGYDVMLNLTDISYGQKGHNKFYQIQIYKEGGKYFFFTKWGRVGAKNPQSKIEEFDSKIDAITEFKRKFKEKTMNDWEDREKFRAKPGKYTMIGVDASTESGQSLNEEISKLNKRNDLIRRRIRENKSVLEESLKSLMELIWDINRMNRTLRELNFDTDKHPLGKLNAEQINKGYRILTEIQNALANKARMNALIDLSNEFYTNIPQNYGMKRPPPIDHILKVKEKLHMLDVLKELEIASKYINLSLVKGNEHLNPLDSFYDLLNVKITKLHPEIDQNCYSMINEALHNTHGPTHNFQMTIQDVFEVRRKGEAERYHPFKVLPNRTMLWHGSRVTNFVGILSEGLRIAPPEAPVTGYMFGKGIYFADVSSKSAGYCRATLENPEGLLVLCEVALGNPYKIHKAKMFKKPPKYCHSVFAEGKLIPEPTGKTLMSEAVYLHCGKVIDNKPLLESGVQAELNYNEYVVYDVAQVIYEDLSSF